MLTFGMFHGYAGSQCTVSVTLGTVLVTFGYVSVNHGSVKVTQG